MSLARICMLASAPPLYIGAASHDETTTTLPLHANAAVGDLAIVVYLAGRSISGGSGNAWTGRATTANSMAVAYKLLEAGDISTPMNFSSATNVITLTIRGPLSLSAERTGVSFTGSTVTMDGFVKSPGSMGFYSAAFGEDVAVSVVPAPGEPDPLNTTTENQGPDAFALQARLGLTPTRYVDNIDFLASTGALGSDKGASVFELMS